MSDNTILNAAAGGDTIATDALATINGAAASGEKVQRVKVGFGSDGDLRDVDATHALPVSVSGTVTVSGGLTDTQLRASAVPVSIASMPSTPVTGTFWQATQPISAAALPLPAGAATDAVITTLTGKLPSSLGVKTAANSLSVAPASDSEFPVRSPAPAATVTASIASSGSLTPSIDLGTERLHRIAMPAAWTAASLTFQASPDGTTWYDLYDYSAGEVTTAFAAANRTLVFDQATFYGIRYLKIRSGSSASPVTQTAQRDLVLVTVPR